MGNTPQEDCIDSPKLQTLDPKPRTTKKSRQCPLFLLFLFLLLVLILTITIIAIIPGELLRASFAWPFSMECRLPGVFGTPGLGFGIESFGLI